MLFLYYSVKAATLKTVENSKLCFRDLIFLKEITVKSKFQLACISCRLLVYIWELKIFYKKSFS